MSALDVRPGDKWLSVKGKRDALVVKVNKRTGEVTFSGRTGAIMRALAPNFVRGRKLVSRIGAIVVSP